jgi:hypothetical protein
MFACGLLQAAEPASTMEAFERLFDGAAFRKGMEVTFTTNNSTSLTTQIDGKTVSSSAKCLRPCPSGAILCLCVWSPAE